MAAQDRRSVAVGGGEERFAADPAEVVNSKDAHVRRSPNASRRQR